MARDACAVRQRATPCGPDAVTGSHAYPDDSVACCLLPQKCNLSHHGQPALVLFWAVCHANAIIAVGLLAMAVWFLLCIAHRYVKVNVR